MLESSTLITENLEKTLPPVDEPPVNEKVQTFVDCTKEINEFLGTSSADVLKDLESIKEHAQNLKQSSDEMSQGAISTHDSIQVAMESSNNAAQSAKTVTQHIIASANMLSEIRDAVKKGVTILQVQREAMTESQNALQELSASMKDVHKQASEIGGITKMMDKIAMSTKILSINASIEAARVGQLGKGFGVVAEEIKKFAANSEEQAKKISSITEAIDTAISSADKKVELTTKVSLHQVEKSEEAASSFNQIAHAVVQADERMKSVQDENDQMRGHVINIQSRFEELASISSQVTVSAENVTETIQQQVGFVDDVLLKMQELDNMTKELNVIVADYEEK